MRRNDYFYLASLELKRNKRRTIRMISGISIGMTFLILTLFLVFVTYFTSMSVADDNKVLNSITFSINNGNTDLKSQYEGLDGIESIQRYGSVELGYRGVEIVIDDKSLINYQMVHGMAVENINPSFVNYIEPEFLVSGNLSISEKEIMISSEYLKKYDVSPNDVVGKKIYIRAPLSTYKYGNYYYENEEEKDVYLDGGYLYLLNEFTISGVYQKIRYIPYNTDFIINSDAIYNVSASKTKVESGTTKYYFEHNFDYYMEEATNNNKLLLINSISSITHISMERIIFDTFNNTLKAYYKVGNEYGIFSSSIEDYINYKKVVDGLTLFFGIVGVIIALISLFGLFGIINYNIEKKRNNIGIMKAIGLNNRGVFKLHLCEFSIYVIRSIIISFIVSLIIALPATIIANKEALNKISYERSVISINFIWYFVAFICVVVLFGVIGYIYTFLATRSVAKDKITDLLK